MAGDPYPCGMSYESFASTVQVRERMQVMARGRNTKPELELRRELWRRGLRGYRLDLDLGLPGVRRRGDVVWVGRKIVVFVDGCFWHCCPIHGSHPQTHAGYWTPKLARNIERDRETDRLARQQNWTVIRVWEHETPADAADRVSAVFSP